MAETADVEEMDTSATSGSSEVRELRPGCYVDRLGGAAIGCGSTASRCSPSTGGGDDAIGGIATLAGYY